MLQMKFHFGKLDREVDLSDVAFVQTYEEALDRYREGVQTLAAEDIAPSARLDRACGLFFEFFDSLFGEDSHILMFDTAKSVAQCSHAFSVLLQSMKRYADKLEKGIA